MPSAGDFEKLGVSYLRRLYDWERKKNAVTTSATSSRPATVPTARSSRFT